MSMLGKPSTHLIFQTSFILHVFTVFRPFASSFGMLYVIDECLMFGSIHYFFCRPRVYSTTHSHYFYSRTNKSHRPFPSSYLSFMFAYLVRVKNVSMMVSRQPSLLLSRWVWHPQTPFPSHAARPWCLHRRPRRHPLSLSPPP